MSNDEYGFGAGGGYTSAQNTNVSFGDSVKPTTASTGTVFKDISTAEFPTEVIQASMQTPVLVDFWAPWCGPCKQLAPNLEKAVAATNGKIRLVKMDIDKHPEVAGQMGIQSIPAVVAFVEGKPADAFMGAKSEAEIREFIAKIAGPMDRDEQMDTLLEDAQTLVDQGDIEAAGRIYGHILSTEPENLKALSAVGHLYLTQNNIAGTRDVIAHLNDEQLASPEIASLLTALDLAEQAEALGNTAGDLASKVREQPEDPQLRLDYAIALNAANQREEAADQLLEIMKQKPGWNEDAARVQLLQFFEAWGMTDETTIAARRKLSSMLFS
jgi:putative thioredoxin